jgi:hypothetical protein
VRQQDITRLRREWGQENKTWDTHLPLKDTLIVRSQGKEEEGHQESETSRHRQKRESESLSVCVSRERTTIETDCKEQEGKKGSRV